MSEQDIEVIRWLYERFAQGDFWAGREVFDPEIEWRWSPRMEAITGARTYRGLAGVEAATRDWFEAWDLFWVEAEEFISAGDAIVVLTRQHGRAKGSDRTLDEEAAEVWTMRDGKAVRHQSYDSWDEALRAVGASR
jgi:ketosteroid isomerase-like protein